jgi:hypothetical protein
MCPSFFTLIKANISPCSQFGYLGFFEWTSIDPSKLIFVIFFLPLLVFFIGPSSSTLLISNVFTLD